jgi:hypothetical protein
VRVSNPNSASEFCVDGRHGARQTSQGESIQEPYLQALGGSYHMATLDWLLNNNGRDNFSAYAEASFGVMQELGMNLGVHRGEHGQGEKSDCGFADNLKKIISTLGERSGEIWDLVSTTVSNEIGRDWTKLKPQWDGLMEVVRGANIDSIPSGNSLITTAEERGADAQQLEGSHQEIAAVVNLKPKTTLDVDNNQKTQAFNLDLWHVIDQAERIGIDKDDAMLLSLGLYVATEMILVEEKRGIRLPIIINH